MCNTWHGDPPPLAPSPGRETADLPAARACWRPAPPGCPVGPAAETRIYARQQYPIGCHGVAPEVRLGRCCTPDQDQPAPGGSRGSRASQGRLTGILLREHPLIVGTRDAQPAAIAPRSGSHRSRHGSRRAGGLDRARIPRPESHPAAHGPVPPARNHPARLAGDQRRVQGWTVAEVRPIPRRSGVRRVRSLRNALAGM